MVVTDECSWAERITFMLYENGKHDVWPIIAYFTRLLIWEPQTQHYRDRQNIGVYRAEGQNGPRWHNAHSSNNEPRREMFDRQ